MIYTSDGRRIRPSAGFVPQWIGDKADQDASAYAVSGISISNDFLQETDQMENNGKADFNQPAKGDMANFKKVADQTSKSSPADASINSAKDWNDVTKDDAKNGQRCC